jgi:TRAP-type transport system periplasmic protein
VKINIITGGQAMKKGLFLLLVLLMVVGVSNLGLAADKPIELKFLSISAKVMTDPQVLTDQWFIDQMEKRTNGRVKVKIFWAGTMGGTKETPFAIKDGLGDLGDLIIPYFLDFFPLNGVGCSMIPMPFNVMELGKKMFELDEKHPQFANEFTQMNFKLLAWRPLEEFGIYSKKPILKFADMKGMKVRTTGPGWIALVKGNGGLPIPMTADELYESLEKGLLDASPMSITEGHRRKIDVVAKYFIEPLGAIMGQTIVMNKNRYNSLPPDIQTIYTKLGREYLDQWVRNVGIGRAEVRDAWKNKLGVTVSTLSPEDLQNFAKSELVKTAHQTWIDVAKSKGVPNPEEIVKQFSY